LRYTTLWTIQPIFSVHATNNASPRQIDKLLAYSRMSLLIIFFFTQPSLFIFSTFKHCFPHPVEKSVFYIVNLTKLNQKSTLISTFQHVSLFLVEKREHHIAAMAVCSASVYNFFYFSSILVSIKT